MIEVAQEEAVFIRKLIAKIQPLRLYAHLPDREAHQAAQRDEWREELKRRAENMLLSQGCIPWDHMETMRCHPDWHTEIYPHLQRIELAIANRVNGGIHELLSSRPAFIEHIAPLAQIANPAQ